LFRICQKRQVQPGYSNTFRPRLGEVATRKVIIRLHIRLSETDTQ